MFYYCYFCYDALVVLASPEILARVEEFFGIKGRKMRIPAILGRPSLDVPILFVIFLGIVLYMGGPRAVLPLVAIAYFLLTSGRST